MTSLSAPAGRRAVQIIPSLAGRPVAIGQAASAAGDDLKLFWMTFSGGLVFFLTFLG